MGPCVTAGTQGHEAGLQGVWVAALSVCCAGSLRLSPCCSFILFEYLIVNKINIL